MVVAIDLPTKHSPRQQWRGFLVPTQLGDSDLRKIPQLGELLLGENGDGEEVQEG